MKRIVSVIGFPILAVVVALATSSLTESLEVANASLLLALVIASAALVDWIAGVATAIVGAVTLNYFHTEPVHSLRITSGSDVVAVVLLAALGIVISAATVFRVSERVRQYHASLSREVGLGITRDQPAPALWRTAIDGEAAELAGLTARLVPAGSQRLPVIARHDTRPDETSSNHQIVRIPASGAVVVLRDPRLGHDLVLSPRDGQTATDARRSVIFMFADTVELSLAHLGDGHARMSK
jgi:Domain of unknown function (DUF4118)